MLRPSEDSDGISSTELVGEGGIQIRSRGHALVVQHLHALEGASGDLERAARLGQTGAADDPLGLRLQDRLAQLVVVERRHDLPAPHGVAQVDLERAQTPADLGRRDELRGGLERPAEGAPERDRPALDRGDLDRHAHGHADGGGLLAVRLPLLPSPGERGRRGEQGQDRDGTAHAKHDTGVLSGRQSRRRRRVGARRAALIADAGPC
jgi:hypothetical protein